MNDVESPLFSVFMCVRWYTTLLYYFFSSPLSITVVVYSIIHSVVVVHFFFLFYLLTASLNSGQFKLTVVEVASPEITFNLVT